MNPATDGVRDWATAALQGGDPTQAVALLTALLDRHPDDAIGWQLLVTAYSELGQLEKAWQAAVKGVRLRRDDPEAYCDLSVVLCRLGRASEARQAVQRALDLDATNTRATAVAAEIESSGVSAADSVPSDIHSDTAGLVGEAPAEPAAAGPPSTPADTHVDLADLVTEGSPAGTFADGVAAPPEASAPSGEAFDCPNCHHPIAVPTRHFMTNIRCRNCREFVDIPTPAAPPAANLDVDLPELPNGVADSGYTDMSGNPEYGCAACGTRLTEPFPRRCPRCQLVLGAPLAADEDVGEPASVPVPESPVPLAAPATGSQGPTARQVAKPWYKSPKGIVNWCLGHDGDAGPGFVESRQRGEHGRLQFECTSCQVILPAKMPDACPECGRVFAAMAPRSAATYPAPVAAPTPSAPPTPATPPPPTSRPQEAEPAAPTMPVRPRSSRRRLLGVGAAAIALVAFLVAYASGAPLRATRKAFDQLAVADAKGVAAPQTAGLVSGFQTDDPARREWLGKLDRVTAEMANQDQVGGWVRAGRFIKNAAALGVPAREIRATLKAVRQTPAPAQATRDAARAFAALETIAGRYSSSRSRRAAAIASLAAKLGVQADEKVVTAAVDDRYQQLVAQERAAQLQAELAANARRQAQEAERARAAASTQQGPQQVVCPACHGSGGGGFGPRCGKCGGSGQVVMSGGTVVSRPVAVARPPDDDPFATPASAASQGGTDGRCPSCKRAGQCSSCLGSGEVDEQTGNPTVNGLRHGEGPRSVDCRRCNGTGKCVVCGGSGRL